MKVLGIVGSPRMTGNTDILVGKVLEAAHDVGAGIEKIMLVDHDISPCKACDTCQKKKKCIHNDDMVSLVQKMQDHDIWVLGTPLYFWGPTAQFKAFLDRWYGAYYSEAVNFKGKRIILVIPFEENDAANACHLVGMLTAAIRWSKAELSFIVLAPGVHERGAVNDRHDLLTKAYDTGLRAVTGQDGA